MAKRRARKPRRPLASAPSSGAAGGDAPSAQVPSGAVGDGGEATTGLRSSPVQDMLRWDVVPVLPLSAGNAAVFALLALVTFGGVKAFSLNSGLALTFNGSVYDELMFGFMILLWMSAGWLFLGFAVRTRVEPAQLWSARRDLVNVRLIALAAGAAVVVQGAQWLLVREPTVFQGLAALPPTILLPLIIMVLGVGVPRLAIRPLVARDRTAALADKPWWIRFGRPALAFWGAIVGSLLVAWFFGALISVVLVAVLRQGWYRDIFTEPDSLFDLLVPALVTLFVVPPVGGSLFARLTAPLVRAQPLDADPVQSFPADASA